MLCVAAAVAVQGGELVRHFPTLESITYAEEIEPGLVLAVTPYRLMLLRPGLESDEHLASYGSTSRYTRTFTRRGNAVYLPETDGSVLIIKLDGSTMTYHDRISFGSGRRAMPVVSGDKMVVVVSNLLRVYSLADPLNPVSVASLPLPAKSPIAAIAADGDRVVCSGSNELLAVDISDAASPKIAGRFDTSNVGDGTVGVAAIVGDYACSFGSARVIVYDISDSAEIKNVGYAKVGVRYPVTVPHTDGLQVGTRSTSRLMTLAADGTPSMGDKYLSTVLLRLLDLATTPEWMAGFSKRWRQASLRFLTGEGNLLCVASSSFVDTYRIEDDGRPQWLSRASMATRSYARVNMHNGIYYSNRGILDLRTPTQPKVHDFPSVDDLSLDGTTGYTLHEGKLQAWDVSDISAVKDTATIQLDTPTDRLLAKDGILYAAGPSGVATFRIDGDELTQLGLFPAPEKWRIYDIVLDDDVLYLGDAQGVAAFDVSDPSNPTLYAQVGVGGPAYRMTVLGGVAFVGAGYRGLQLADLRSPGVGSVIDVNADMAYSYATHLHKGFVYVNHREAGFSAYTSPLLTKLEASRTARQPLEAKLKNDPKDVDTLAALAAICEEQGYASRAGIIYRRLIALDPDGPHTAKASALQARLTAATELSKRRRTFVKIAYKEGLASIELDGRGNPIAMRARSSRVFSKYADVVATFTKLKELSVGGIELTAEQFAAIGKMTELRELDLTGTGLSDETVVHLKSLTELRELSLEDNKALTNVGIAHLAGFKSLVQLNLEGTKVTDAGLQHLGSLTQLSSLNLSQTGLTGGLDMLVGMPLVALDISYTKVDDAQIAHLAGIPTLQRVRVHDTQMTDAGLASIAKLSALEYITMWDTQITDAGIVHLKGLKRLETVVMGSTAITDETLAIMATLPRLATLNVDNTGVTDSGLIELREMPSLAELSIDETKVTDTGLIGLAKLPTLKWVSVEGTSVTRAGVLGLLELRPKIEVMNDLPAITPDEQAEEKRLPRMPAKLAFQIADNELVLSDADGAAEFARETPPDLFGAEPVVLQGLVAWEGECWLGSDHGLLRFEPRTRVWSRFAIDREHLDVSVRELEQREDLLIVHYGEAQEARFHLRDRRWLVAAVAESAAQPQVQQPSTPSRFGRIAVFFLWVLIGVLLILFRRKHSR